jgi:Domain of unknown function (DUF5096)
MEEYIGANLMIKTGSATVIGVLQNIDPGTLKMNIEVGGGTVGLDIADIEALEIITDEDSRLFGESEMPFRDPAIIKAGDVINKEGVSSPETEASVQKIEPRGKDASVPNKQDKEMKPEQPLDQKADPRKRAHEHVSLEKFMEILEESSQLYGPTRKEVLCSGSRGVLHLFVNIFKIMEKKLVVYVGRGIFAEMAVILARLCISYNVNVSIIRCGPNSASIAKELFYYTNNGGVLECERSSRNDVVVAAGIEATDEMVEGAESVIFLGGYSKVRCPSKHLIFFGVPTQDFAAFSGEVILCDVGISPAIYTNHGIKKYSPKILQKIVRHS